jgi:DNA-binding LacI/PurR family transcriptional regulator
MSSLLALPGDKRPTAVVAYNDLLAIGALRAVQAHQLLVPADISIVGFDGIMMAAHSAPPLTTIDQPKYQMGILAMRQLRQMMDGLLPQGSYILLDSPLVVRESTAPC